MNSTLGSVVPLAMFVKDLLTRAVVVETKQMVVVLAVTEVNEEVVVQNFGWKMTSQKKNTFNYFLFFLYCISYNYFIILAQWAIG